MVSRFIVFAPSLALALGGAGVEISGYENPELAWILWGLAGLLLLVPVAYWLWRRKSTPDSSDGAGKRVSAINLDDMDGKAAIAALKNWATDHSNVNTLVYPHHQVPLVERINDWFRLAGWQVDPNSTPQERYSDKYVQGVEVSGVSPQLVGAVAAALSGAGVPMVRTKILELRTKPGNPKYQSNVETVHITIGHTTT